MIKNKKGFTLIELVTVVVILGVVAAVAAPKFIDLSSDSKIAVLDRIKGAFKSVSSMANSKAIIQNIENGSISIDGNDIEVKAGYPSGHWNKTWRFAIDVGKDIGFTRPNAVCTQNSLCGVGNQRRAPSLPFTPTNRGLVLIWLEGMKLSDLCYSYYYNDESGEAPKVGTVITGC